MTRTPHLCSGVLVVLLMSRTTFALPADQEAIVATAEQQAAEGAAAKQLPVDAATAQRSKQEHAHNTLAAPPNLQQGTLPATAYAKSNDVSAAFLLEGSTDEKTGIASIGWKTNREQFRLSAKGPLDKKTQQASPLSLDGLSANSTVEVSFNHLQWSPSNDEEISEIVGMCREIRTAACQRDPSCRLSVLDIQNPCAAPKIPDDCPNLCCEDIKKEAKLGTLERCHPKKPAICTQKLCDYQNVPPQYKRHLAALLHLHDPIMFWGGSASVGRSTFDYLEGTTLEAKSVTRNAWTASGRVGFLSSLGFVIGSYTYQKDYKPGSAEQQVCQPLVGTSATTCDSAILGPPTVQTRSILMLELRRFLANGVALAPAIQRDLKKKITLVALPVYFLKSDSGGATGGVRLAWRSDKKSATLSVFVGAALGLTP